MSEWKRFYLNTSSMTAKRVAPRPERDLWNFYPRPEPKIRSVEGGPHFYGNGVDDDAPWLQYQMDLAAETDKVVRLPEGSVYLLSPVQWRHDVAIHGAGAGPKSTIRAPSQWLPDYITYRGTQ